MRYVIMHNGVEYTPMKGDVEYNFVVGEDLESSFNISKVKLSLEGTNVIVKILNCPSGIGNFSITYEGLARSQSRSLKRNSYHCGRHERLYNFTASVGETIVIPINQISIPRAIDRLKDRCFDSANSNGNYPFTWKGSEFTIRVWEYYYGDQIPFTKETESNSIRILKQ